jgi:hypothetical protein
MAGGGVLVTDKSPRFRRRSSHPSTKPVKPPILEIVLDDLLSVCDCTRPRPKTQEQVPHGPEKLTARKYSKRRT